MGQLGPHGPATSFVVAELSQTFVCSVSPLASYRSAVPGGPAGPVPGPAGHHMLPGEGGLAETFTHQEDAT